MLSFLSSDSYIISDFKQKSNIDTGHILNLGHSVSLSSINHWQEQEQSSQFMLLPFLPLPPLSRASGSGRE